MQIIFEDDSILVVSKPTGQIVNRAETTRGEVTLQDELEKYLGIKRWAAPHPSFARKLASDARVLHQACLPARQDFEGRAGIVHRLDKNTSGVLVVAKTPEAFTNLQAQFKEREVAKEYLALVHGEIKEKDGSASLTIKGKIEAPIARNPKDRMRFAVVPGGRKAVTEYEVVRSQESVANGEEFSYLRVKPLTGRTHQIRVHLKYIGHPVVSDPLYLSHRRLKEDRQWCPRIFLHAESLGFTHPQTEAWVRFEVELPEDLQKALASLIFSRREKNGGEAKAETRTTPSWS